jgi:hypothetical protein
MSAQHTAGPWEVTDVIANETPMRRIRSLHCRSMVLAHINENYDGEANARLIAAAPDLLAALCAVLDWFDDWNVEIGPAELTLLDQVRAAIAKAEGT